MKFRIIRNQKIIIDVDLTVSYAGGAKQSPDRCTN
jgi:hypothetical protein